MNCSVHKQHMWWKFPGTDFRFIHSQCNWADLEKQ